MRGMGYEEKRQVAGFYIISDLHQAPSSEWSMHLGGHIGHA